MQERGTSTLTVYLCGILLDEWLCPFRTTAPAGHERTRRSGSSAGAGCSLAGLTAAALAGLAGVALERWWLGPTDATAAARVESLVRREFGGMIAALADGRHRDCRRSGGPRAGGRG